MKGLFITGTDTGVGKTSVSILLGLFLQQRGIKVGLMKPIATGGHWEGDRLVSPDAIYMKKALSLEDEPELINPLCLEPPLAPLVAARLTRQELNLVAVREAFETLAHRYDYLIVEGIGGLLVPLTRDTLVADLARDLALPLLVVARPSLGTINHTLLTIRCARHEGLTIRGFILNDTSGTEIGLAELTNPQIIEELTQVPFCGYIPFLGPRLLERLNPLYGRVLEYWLGPFLPHLLQLGT